MPNGRALVAEIVFLWLVNPDQVEFRPPLVQQLAALNREQLLELVLELADRKARLNETIEAILPDIAGIESD